MADIASTRTRMTALAGEAGRIIWRRMRRSRLLRWRYRNAEIDQLRLMPQDLRTADPSFATEIYHGQFGLAGAIAVTGTESPFSVHPPSLAWERELHGFAWLNHLHAAGDEISRQHARALIRDWIRLHVRYRGVAWEPEVLARRVISWLSHARTILDGASAASYEAVLKSLAEQTRYLAATYREAPDGEPRLTSLIALNMASLCTTEDPRSDAPMRRRLEEELRRQIFPDGGHISRNPVVLAELLLDLLPLRQCFGARDLPPPPELIAAIDRMMPMLRFFRLGDGDLVRFNGTGATQSDGLAAVLAYDDAQGTPAACAEHSGYCRLEQGGTLIIADTGRPPPPAVSGAAHAGCLSFEMSSGPCPLIVNCGAPPAQSPDWRAVARTTAAHSTLTLDDTASSIIVPTGAPDDPHRAARLSGPTNVQAGLNQEDITPDLRASHDGYDQRFGVTHIRRLRLSSGGATINGQDQLIAPHGLRGSARASGGAFAIRFHLHPSVRAELSHDGRTALLVLPNREGWQMTAKGHQLAIEDSVFLADLRGPRRCTQVVITGALGHATELAVDWVLEKSSEKAPLVRKSEAEEDAGDALLL